MARNVLVDAGFLVAVLSRRDRHHVWAAAQAPHRSPPWLSCEPVLSETCHLLGPDGTAAFGELLRRGAVTLAFSLRDEISAVLTLMRKYANVPMSLADACLVRMTEMLSDPLLLTTDADFRVYRRHGRHIIPCVMP